MESPLTVLGISVLIVLVLLVIGQLSTGKWSPLRYIAWTLAALFTIAALFDLFVKNAAESE